MSLGIQCPGGITEYLVNHRSFPGNSIITASDNITIEFIEMHCVRHFVKCLKLILIRPFVVADKVDKGVMNWVSLRFESHIKCYATNATC